MFPPTQATPKCSWTGGRVIRSDAIDDDALTTFLLEWCPRHLSLPANESAEVCEAVASSASFSVAPDA